MARARYRSADMPRTVSGQGHYQSMIMVDVGNIDVIDILKSEHQELVQRFGELFAQPRDDHYLKGIDALCTALKIHMNAESEIFYPKFLRATHDALTHLCASLNLENVKVAIDDIEHTGPGDVQYAQRVHELYTLFAHHARDAEKPGGLFEVARHSTLDGAEVGRAVLLRERELAAGMNCSGGAVKPAC
jgi:hypothetical protein